MSRTTAVLAHSFRALFDQLVSDLRGLKQASPLSRVTIVVPGSALLRWVRRELGGEPLLGVQVTTLNGIANRVLGPDALQTDEVVSGEVHRLLLTQLQTPPWLAAVDRPEPLIHAVFRDLYDAGLGGRHIEAASELLADDPWWERGQQLLAHYGEWRAAAVDAGLVDRTARVREAVERLRDGAGCGADHLLWYGIYDLTGVMADLVRVLCRTTPGRFYFPAFARGAELPPVPETPDQYLQEVFDTALAPVVAERTELSAAADDPVIEVFHASGEEGELTTVARRIARWAADFDGDPPWHTVAVVARDLTPYIGVARRVFQRFRVPVRASRQPPARTHGRIRGLLAICDIARDGLRRDRFMDAIRFGGLEARAVYGVARGPLDAALRQFGVVGHDDWAALLEHLEAGRALVVPARIPADPSSDSRSRRPGLADAVTDALSAHVRAVLAALDGWPAVAPVAAHLERWRALVQAVLTRDDDVADGVAADLEPTPGQVHKGAVLACLERLIEGAQLESAGSDGVALLDVMSARGMVFDHVYLVGLNRRRWPRAIREDPLLPDRVRRRLRSDLGLDSLPVKERGHAEEALLFSHASGSAQKTLTLSYQRSDADGKALVHSPFLDGVLALCGDRIEAVPRRRYDVLAPLVAAGHGAALTTADLGWWLAVREQRGMAIEIARLTADPVRRMLFHAGIAAMELRDDVSGPINAADGLIGRPFRETERRPLAPTRVEGLLRCPWQAFVTQILGVKPVEQAGELPGIDPLRRGIVVHAVHERLVKWLDGAEPDDELLWEDARELAHRWASAELDETLEDEPTIAPLVRAMLGPGLSDRIDALVDCLENAVSVGRIPAEAEARLSGTVTLDDGRTVQLSARADRIDTRGGRREIADIKTGKPPADVATMLDQMGRGRRLQAPFYHWVGAASDDAEPVAWAGYEHVLDGPDHRRIGLDRPTFAMHEPALRRVLNVGVDLLEAGTFPLRRGRHCDFCDVTATCARHHRPATWRLEQLDDADSDGLPDDEAAVTRYRRMAQRGLIGGKKS